MSVCLSIYLFPAVSLSLISARMTGQQAPEICFPLPRAGITHAAAHGFFRGCWGSELGSLRFPGQHFPYRAISLALWHFPFIQECLHGISLWSNYHIPGCLWSFQDSVTEIKSGLMNLLVYSLGLLLFLAPYLFNRQESCLPAGICIAYWDSAEFVSLLQVLFKWNAYYEFIF